tara:strand:- start:1612 stop:3474 length:1863 start_codon:yes stop_codon:yes gene_type:complete
MHMRIGIRGKLFAVSVILILAVGLSTAIYLESQLRSWMSSQTRSHLLKQAYISRNILQQSNPKEDITKVDKLADTIGKELTSRVTIINKQGRVLGDSKLNYTQLKTLDNHSQRPEILRAQKSGKGIVFRYSNTLKTQMLYVAVPYAYKTHQGTLRIAVPLKQIEKTIWRVRAYIILASLFGLIVAILMSGLASYLMDRTFNKLLENARRIVKGSHDNLPAIQTLTVERNRPPKKLQETTEEWEELITTLTEERNRFEAVLHNMNASVLALNKDLEITMANPSARSHLGLSQLAIGKPLNELVPSPELDKLAKKARAGQVTASEFALPGPMLRRVLVRATPQQGNDGAVLVMHDVTNLRRLETIRRDFVANVSHELRTPLSIIHANTETLLDGALNEPKFARKFLEASLRNTNRLSELIDDILNLSKIEAGQYQISHEEIHVEKVAQSAINSVKAAKNKHIEITTDVAQDTTLWADARAFDQVLLNLLDNAVKYTPEGGRVTIRAVQHGEYVRVEVQDNGPGLEPHHRERIFERFYRVDEGRSRHIGGTGLGLAIVKHLVQAMRGQVGVEAAKPSGSIFWFTLPANVPLEDEDEDDLGSTLDAQDFGQTDSQDRLIPPTEE